ncbi:MAG: glycosyltransferase [Spirochaetota bacterium]
MDDRFRVAFVCGKLGDVDGVSLEVEKWIRTLQSHGHSVVTIAGKYRNTLESVASEDQHLMERIRFDSPEQQYYETSAFPHLNRRPPHQSREKIALMLDQLEADGTEVANWMDEIIHEHDIDVLIAENTNAMPMTLVGGMAMYKLATERRMATIFHHHDFWWERSRFSNNYIEGLLTKIMPPADLGLEHTVISSYAAHILTSLKRVKPHVVTNCEDFDHPVWKDAYNGDFREQLGFREDDLLVMQPTRIVRRKRIEDSLAFVRRLLERYPEYRGRTHYVISLYQGDEPDQRYIETIHGIAEDAGIPLHLISDRVASVRGTDAEGRKLYTNRDVLAHADFVTYLPVWEGFGNALLEAVAAKVPIVTTTYLVYKTDVMPLQLRNVEIRDTYDAKGHLVIPDHAVDEIVQVIKNPDERQERVEHNFNVARREFGMDVLSRKLRLVFQEYGDEIRASRKRRAKAGAPYSV